MLWCCFHLPSAVSCPPRSSLRFAKARAARLGGLRAGACALSDPPLSPAAGPPAHLSFARARND